MLGRPRQILLGSTVIGIGAIIQTCSWTVASMMVGRIVAGLGTGINTATAGVWQAETSKMNSRGKLVIIQMGKSDFSNPSSMLLTRFTSQLHNRLQHLQLAHPRLLIRTARHSMALPARIPALLHLLHLRHVSLPPRLAPPPDPQRQARRSARSHRCAGRPRRNSRLSGSNHTVQNHQGYPRPRTHEHVHMVAVAERQGPEWSAETHGTWRVDAGYEPDLRYQRMQCSISSLNAFILLFTRLLATI